MSNLTFRTLAIRGQQILDYRNAKGYQTPEAFRRLIAEVSDPFPDCYQLADLADDIRKHDNYYLEFNDDLVILVRDALLAVKETLAATKGALH
ncbi:MAG: hypothetical protein HWE20_14685 [Gammaproteobacteria bacterium]|nr:hypothetical protein [Gammaproteobacteria bacterium]